MAPISFLRFAVAAPFLILASTAQTQTSPNNKTETPTQKGVQFQLSPAKTPLVFEPNLGQAASNFQWIGRGAGFRLGIGNDGATLEFADRKATSPAKPKFLNPSDLLKPQANPKSAPDTLVKLHLSGSNGWKPAGAEPSGGISNYFIGKTPAAWHTDIPQYAQVKVVSVYQGVDLIFHGDESTLEYDFVIAPGSDPRQIQLQFEGATSLEVDKANGDLVLETANKTELLRHAQPKIYQLVDGKHVPIKGGFQVVKGNTASFTIEKYDHAKSLVIDPTIRFVTFLGGSDTDAANAVAVDGRGFSYVTGQTYSGNFNVVGGVIQTGRSGDSDAFVTKLGTGGNIVFSTYLGGGDNDIGYGIAVDASGVYVAGQTHSGDFPVAQAYQFEKKAGDGTVFVTKLSPSGNRLVYSTYLGGSDGENGGAIAIDASQSAYVAGHTTSRDFPVVNGYEYYRGAAVSGFVSKLAPNGVSLVYSTYLGGSNVDSISGIAVDSSLSAYVTGEAISSDFPYAGYQSTMFGGSPSAFLTKLSPAGDSLVYSTSLSLETTVGTAVSLDSAGNAYVAGTFCSPCESPHPDLVFVSKVSPAGKLAYSKLFSGTDGSSDGYAIATDASGETWVAGSTSSTTFPGAPPLTPNPTAGLLMKLDANGNGPLYTIFLGASINGVAVTKPNSRWASTHTPPSTPQACVTPEVNPPPTRMPSWSS
ncbi:SBBP repeat-containing protein [Tunturibacter psychrotolerans]|uniref:SBBP repeat-containing protein n=1 Tax=Tunturiibacter psychrotolerans TaxID=3069686 RepID=A0AAU7ZPT7_9BACT